MFPIKTGDLKLQYFLYNSLMLAEWSLSILKDVNLSTRQGKSNSIKIFFDDDEVKVLWTNFIVHGRETLALICRKSLLSEKFLNVGLTMIPISIFLVLLSLEVVVKKFLLKNTVHCSSKFPLVVLDVWVTFKYGTKATNFKDRSFLLQNNSEINFFTKFTKLTSFLKPLTNYPKTPYKKNKCKNRKFRKKDNTTRTLYFECKSVRFVWDR